MTKMFTYNGQKMITWNPFTGCNFACSYCWARKLAEEKLKATYPSGFIPTTRPDRFNKRFKPDDFVFVCSMGDITFAPSGVQEHVITTTLKYPDTKFLLCSKDPDLFRKVIYHKPNIFLGTTIETNRNYKVGSAPMQSERLRVMKSLNHQHKFISIEPIMDFDLGIFVMWLKEIEPEIVEVGADNYHNFLPEPPPAKVNALLKALREFVPTVIEKQGLERVK